jgi:hypothetical protein
MSVSLALLLSSRSRQLAAYPANPSAIASKSCRAVQLTTCESILLGHSTAPLFIDMSLPLHRGHCALEPRKALHKSAF